MAEIVAIKAFPLQFLSKRNGLHLMLSVNSSWNRRSPPFGVVTALLITDSIQKADIQQQMNIVAAGGDNTINWVKSRPCIQLQSGGTV